MILWFCFVKNNNNNNFPDIQFYQWRLRRLMKLWMPSRPEAEKEPSLTSSTDSQRERALSPPPSCDKYSSTNDLPFHILCSFPLNWQLALLLTYGKLYLILFTESSYLVLKLYARAEPQHNRKQVFFTILRFTMWLNILQQCPQILIAFTLKV